MNTQKTTTHMKAPLPGHLETSPSEAHARGCGPVGLAGYKRDPIGRAHSTIWIEGILSAVGMKHPKDPRAIQATPDWKAPDL